MLGPWIVQTEQTRGLGKRFDLSDTVYYIYLFGQISRPPQSLNKCYNCNMKGLQIKGF